MGGRLLLSLSELKKWLPPVKIFVPRNTAMFGDILVATTIEGDIIANLGMLLNTPYFLGQALTAKNY
jgi:hypothetical protein